MSTVFFNRKSFYSSPHRSTQDTGSSLARSATAPPKEITTNFEQKDAVAGDGTNEAPPLHASGAAPGMSIAKIEVTKESTDAIISDDNFQVVTLLRWACLIYKDLQELLQLQLMVNVITMIVSFVLSCLTGNSPLTAVQLLWFNIIMIALGALALATEASSNNSMTTSPVCRKQKLINNLMWRKILSQSMFQSVIIWSVQMRGEAIFTGLNSDTLHKALIFNSFVFSQVFDEINSIEIEKINVLKIIPKNSAFVVVVCCTVVFQIAIVNILSMFANVPPPSCMVWFVTILIGFLSVPINAAIKMPSPCL